MSAEAGWRLTSRCSGSSLAAFIAAVERHQVRWADKRTTERPFDGVRLLQAVLPITRLPAVMRNGEDSDMRRHFQVDDVIGKARDGSASNRQVSWESPDPCPGARHHYD
jgi:hypothetical protein